MVAPIRIHWKILEDIRGRAKATPDAEICGGVVQGVLFPILNIEPNPRTRFMMDPGQQLDLYDMWGGVGELIIYHSHTQSPSGASGRDEQAIEMHPEAIFVIYSVPFDDFSAYRNVAGSATRIHIYTQLPYTTDSTQPIE